MLMKARLGGLASRHMRVGGGFVKVSFHTHPQKLIIQNFLQEKIV
jgi:hypothetical protein